jgi:hypothetical protein
MTETTTRALAQEIKVAARICELKEPAADTTEAYQRELVASGLPEQHFRLRLRLLGRLLPPPRKGGA